MLLTSLLKVGLSWILLKSTQLKLSVTKLLQFKPNYEPVVKHNLMVPFMGYRYVTSTLSHDSAFKDVGYIFFSLLCSVKRSCPKCSVDSKTVSFSLDLNQQQEEGKFLLRYHNCLANFVGTYEHWSSFV